MTAFVAKSTANPFCCRKSTLRIIRTTNLSTTIKVCLSFNLSNCTCVYTKSCTGSCSSEAVLSCSMEMDYTSNSTKMWQHIFPNGWNWGPRVQHHGSLRFSQYPFTVAASVLIAATVMQFGFTTGWRGDYWPCHMPPNRFTAACSPVWSDQVGHTASTGDPFGPNINNLGTHFVPHSDNFHCWSLWYYCALASQDSSTVELNPGLWPALLFLQSLTTDDWFQLAGLARIGGLEVDRRLRHQRWRLILSQFSGVKVVQ